MPQAREHYAKIFGAPVLDDYGMGECLFLTNGCAKSGGMHVNADWALLEVVDEKNQPVPDWRDGREGARHEPGELRAADHSLRNRRHRHDGH